MLDIIVPRGNEVEFAKVAKKLGYTGLICIGKEKKVKTVIPLYWTTDIKKATDKLRGMIEQRKASLIYDTIAARKDYIHHRGSALNQVLCKLMKKKEISVAFSFGKLLHSSLYKRGLLMGRMKMNIGLCRKYKIPMVVGSFATRPYELRSFRDLSTLFCQIGMHPQEVKDGQKLLSKFIN